MAVLSDWSCAAHGVFESMTGRCPHGCSNSFVNKVFLQAPGLKSARTTNIDKTLQNLAGDFGLTDLNNQGGTSAVVRPNSRAVAAREQLMGKLGDTSHAWGQIPTGSAGVNQAIASQKLVPDNALSSIKPSLVQPRPMVVGKHDAKIEA